MKTIEMQTEFNGEWFPIWSTNETDLETVWKEVDEQPALGGHIRFKGDSEFLVVNGGFR